MMRTAFALIIPLLLATAVTPVSAQVESVTLRVDGLACPFCAYGLEKKLKALEGFRTLDVQINDGKVNIAWRPDQPIALADIEEAVKKAGFTLRSVRGTVLGKAVAENGRYFLELPTPPGQRFFLYDSTHLAPEDDTSHAAEGTAEALGDTAQAQLDASRAARETLRITGLVHSHTDGALPLGLAIEDLEVLPDQS